MTWQSSLPTFIFLASAVLAAMLATITWRWRGRPGGQAFFLLIGAAAVWSLVAALEGIVEDLPLKIFFAQLQYVGAASAAPLWVIFALGYTQQDYLLTRRNLMLMTLIPAITLGLVFTNEWHRLIWKEIQISFPIPGAPPLLVYEHGLWFWVSVAYGYFLMMVGTVALVVAVLRFPDVYCSRAVTLMVGAVLPWIANGVYLVGVTPAMNLTPLSFGLTGLIYNSGTVFRCIFHLVPVPRELLVENLLDGVLVLDAQHRIVDVNNRFVQIAKKMGLRVEKQSLLGRRTDEVFAAWPDLLERYYHVEEAHEEVRLPAGEDTILDLRISTLRDAKGRPIGRLILIRELGEQQRMQEQLKLQGLALEAAANAIIITNRDGVIQWVNPAFTRITGYSAEEAIGQTPRILKSNQHGAAFYEDMWGTLLLGRVWRGEIVNRCKDGRLYTEEQTITPVRNEKGEITHFIAIKQDITARKEAEDSLRRLNENLRAYIIQVEELQGQLREQSIRDPLTGLFNRRYLEETLERELARAGRLSMPVAIVMLDIDHFKEINDAHGHDAGDVVLRLLGDLLDDLVRSEDIACRYGGEEFVVVMPGASAEIGRQRAEEWRLAFAVMHTAYQGVDLHATLSAGVAAYPAHGKTAGALLRTADRALYKAKEAGRNCVVVWRGE